MEFIFTSLKAWTRVWRYFSKHMATSLVRMAWPPEYCILSLFILITQKLDATAKNVFQILILHPIKYIFKEKMYIFYCISSKKYQIYAQFLSDRLFHIIFRDGNSIQICWYLLHTLKCFLSYSVKENFLLCL